MSTFRQAQQALQSELGLEPIAKNNDAANGGNPHERLAKGANELRVIMGEQPVAMPDFGVDADLAKSMAGPDYTPSLFSDTGSEYPSSADLFKSLSGGDAATAELLDGVPILTDLTKGFTDQLETVHAELAAQREMNTALLKGMGVVMEAMLAGELNERARFEGLIKSLSKVPAFQADPGLLAMVSRSGAVPLTENTAAQPDGTPTIDNTLLKGRSVAEEVAAGLPSRDEAFVLVKSVLQKEDTDKTPGERLLTERHMNVQRNGIDGLPLEYRKEKGWA